MARGGLTKLRINSPGVLAILKSQGVANDIARRGNAVHAALPLDEGEEWFVRNFIGSDRAQSIIGTQNKAAKQSAAETNALQRALDRGR